MAHDEQTSKHEPVEKLLLDDQNPRLPEDLQGKSQPRILRYLYETANLFELAQSFVDNDFFAHEPLIALKGAKGKLTVVEGNRRLATLMILLQLPAAGDLAFPDIALSKAKKDVLSEVPCFTIKNREEVYRFLGFRHIGGIRTWSAEAKARYIYNEAVSESRAKSEDVFLAVSRRTGLEKGAVRTSCLAYALLMAARDLGIDVARLQSHDERRFGVWTRAMSSTDIRAYLGIGDVSSFEDLAETVSGLKKKPLSEVIGDIAPRPGLPEVLPDSRDVTTYGRILSNKAAREEMRLTRSMDGARAIIEKERLPLRLAKITRSVARLAEDILGATADDLEEIRSELVTFNDAATRLQRAVKGAGK